MIEGHGNDRYNYGDRVKIDFSSNIAFNNHSNMVVEYLHGRLFSIKNYPDPTARVLSQKIALRYGYSVESLMVCNGSAEAFYLVAYYISLRSRDVARSLIFTPSFAEYEDSCRVYGHKMEYAALADFKMMNYSSYDSVWIGTPNNPDGFRVSIGDIEDVARRNPSCIFVVDRAYNDLSASCDRVGGSILDNLIFINSLTKTFGIPGLRLGYVVATERVIDQLSQMRPPWSVNALSLEAGEYVMDNYDILSVDIDKLLEESSYLQRELSKLPYLEIVPSDANFFLCRVVDGRSAEQLHSYLVEKHGILIRNASNFRGLTPSHFRIAAQSREENNILIKALGEWTTSIYFL